MANNNDPLEEALWDSLRDPFKFLTFVLTLEAAQKVSEASGLNLSVFLLGATVTASLLKRGADAFAQGTSAVANRLSRKRPKQLDTNEDDHHAPFPSGKRAKFEDDLMEDQEDWVEPTQLEIEETSSLEESSLTDHNEEDDKNSDDESDNSEDQEEDALESDEDRPSSPDLLELRRHHENTSIHATRGSKTDSEESDDDDDDSMNSPPLYDNNEYRGVADEAEDESDEEGSDIDDRHDIPETQPVLSTIYTQDTIITRASHAATTPARLYAARVDQNFTPMQRRLLSGHHDELTFLQALLDISHTPCADSECQYFGSQCTEFGKAIDHVSSCSVKSSTTCGDCKAITKLLWTHSKECRNTLCDVPSCLRRRDNPFEISQ